MLLRFYRAAAGVLTHSAPFAIGRS